MRWNQITVLKKSSPSYYALFFLLLTTAYSESSASSAPTPNISSTQSCTLGAPLLNIRDWTVSEKSWGLRPTLCEKAQVDAILSFNTLFPPSKSPLSLNEADKKTEMQTRYFLRRLFVLLTLTPLTYTSKNNDVQNLKPWNYPLSIALAHGGRILIEVSSPQKLSQDSIINTLITGKENQIPLPKTLMVRSAASHGMKQETNGVIAEEKLGLAGTLKNLELGLKKKHKGYNISFGGLGNPDINGNIVGPGGTRFTPPSAQRQIQNIQHGHMYVQSADFSDLQVVLLGIEPSAPGKTSMTGQAHSAMGAFTDPDLVPSITGDQKMSKIMSTDTGPAALGGLRAQLTLDQFKNIIAIANKIIDLPEAQQEEIFKKLVTSSVRDGQTFLAQKGFSLPRR